MFFAPRKPKTTVFTMFSASGSKNHGIYSVFWTAPSKNIGIYTVFGMLQEVIFPCKSHKTCKLQCFGSAFRVYAVEGGGWGEGIQKEQQPPE